MIFISGVHGVGKSFFSEKIKEEYGLNTYMASRLISDYKNCDFQPNKKVSNIIDNQKMLLLAIEEKSEKERTFLLDGHFCLIDNNNNITRIELNTFEDLQLDAIVLLTEEPHIIACRRKNRDGISIDTTSIKEFQEEEIKYAIEVAERLHIPLFISRGTIDIENAIRFIIDNI